MEQPDLDREFVELARRVSAIEQHLGLVPRPAAAAPQPVPQAAPSSELPELMPALGRALLGLAGAYLIRALTDSGSLPLRAGVAIGISYALGWLLWAARTPAEHRIRAALHSLTAVLVLAPLLWEATLRFHAVSTSAAGGILLLFTVFGLAVSWKKNVLIVATIATLAGVGTASALLVASRDVLPFTFVLLAIAAAVETSACMDHWLSERWLAALAADAAVLLATWLVTNPRGLPESYAPVPHGWLLFAQAALLAVYLGSIIIRTLLRRCTFTAFETAQCAAAFLISLSGGLRLSPAMAAVALVCGAACYLVSFAMLERQGRGRNFYTYSTFGILLIVAGSRIVLSGAPAAAAWTAAGLACLWAGGHFASLTLQVHGGIYLLLSMAVFGTFRQAAVFLFGAASRPAAPEVLALAAGASAAAVGYWLAAKRDADAAGGRLFRLGMAAIFAWLAAGAAAGLLTGAYHGVFGAGASHAYCATIRTGLLAASAVFLAWVGREWKHLIYPAMALGGYRLLTDDLRQERNAALFLSLLLYGAALIALPRVRGWRGVSR